MYRRFTLAVDDGNWMAWPSVSCQTLPKCTKARAATLTFAGTFMNVVVFVGMVCHVAGTVNVPFAAYATFGCQMYLRVALASSPNPSTSNVDVTQLARNVIGLGFAEPPASEPQAVENRALD